MPLLFISLFACAPDDGTIDASYAFFMADDTSDALIDVRLRNKFDKQTDLKAVDCRTLDDETFRLPGADAACADKAPSWFSWLESYDYYLKEGTISNDAEGEGQAWRTEAVITSEGDFQLTVHARVGDFGDFRFGWSINPNFQPKTCADDGTGGATLQDIDGAWVDGWSSEDAGYKVWHLNTYSYQINPNSQEDYWSLPREWYAGYSFGRFGDEPLVHTGTFYNTYADGGLVPLYYPYAGSLYDMEPKGVDGVEDFPPGSDYGSIDEWADAVQTYLETSADLQSMGGATFVPTYRVHSNSWREADSFQSGLDNWVEAPMSFVRLKEGYDISEGKSSSPKVEGDFQLYLVGENAPSRMFIKGSFSIDNIRQNTAYTPTLEELKREENNTPSCE